MSCEYINHKSAVPWTLIPLSDTMPYKDINEKVHHNSACLSKEYDSFSQTESNRDISKSENGSYLPNRRDTLHSETRSETVHVNTKKYDNDSFKCTSHTVSKEPVSRYFHKRDEYKSHSSERYLRYESDRSRTHSTYVYSEHHSHSKQQESFKIPRTTCENSVSQALRSLRSRSVSQSRTVPRSVQNIAKGRYDVRNSSRSRSSDLTKTLDKHTIHALKPADKDPSTYHLKTQLPTQTQPDISKDLICKPQNKFTHGSELHSVMKASNTEFEFSLKMPDTELGIKTQTSPCAENIHRSGSTTTMNLSEHNSFKRSRRAKIVKLNSETKSTEARNSVNNSDLVKNTNTKLFYEDNQVREIKRTLESNETDKAHLPHSKRRALDDIRGSYYTYRENDKSANYEQIYNDKARKQLNSGSVSKNMLRNDKFTKYESDNIKNVDTAVLEETNSDKEQKEETELQRSNKLDFEESKICEDDKQPPMENTLNVKETIRNMRTTSDRPKSDERDKNTANRKESSQQHGEHNKFTSDTKPSDTQRNTSGSVRYNLKRHLERSCMPLTFNSHHNRQSPSELLSQDRAGSLSNQDGNAGTRSRRRSFEEATSIGREPKRYKIMDSFDGRSVRCKANNISSEEERKKNKYSKDESIKSSSSENSKEKKGKHEVEADGRQDESCSINFKKVCLLETDKNSSVIKSRTRDDCRGQTESAGRTECTRPTILNKKQKSDSKHLQHGASILPITEPSDPKEMIKMDTADKCKNSLPRSNSVESNMEITRSRSNSCKKSNDILTETENNTSLDRVDEKCVTYETHKLDCDDERKKNKNSEDKSKESCTSYFQNDNIEKEKNSVEVKQTEVFNAKESEASGKEEVQKCILLESNTEDSTMDDNSKGQTESSIERIEDAITDIVTRTPKSDCVELQHVSSELPVMEPLVSNELIKTGTSENSYNFLPKSNSLEINRSCDEGTEFQDHTGVDSHQERCLKDKIDNAHSEDESRKSNNSDIPRGQEKNNEINLDENEEREHGKRREAKACRQEECVGSVQKESLTDTNKEDNMKSKLHDGYNDPIDSAVKGIEDVMPTMTDEKKSSDCEDSEDRSSKQLTTETVNTNKERIKKTELRNYNSEEQSGNKSTTEEETKITEQETDKEKSHDSQNYEEDNKKIDEHNDTEVQQMEVNNSEEGKANRKDGDCSGNVQQISLLKKSEGDRVMVSEIQYDCSDQKESAKEGMEDTVLSIRNEQHNADLKDSSKQPVTESSVSDEVNRTEKAMGEVLKSRSKHSSEEKMVTRSRSKHRLEEKIVTRSRSKHGEQEKRASEGSRKYETSDNFNGSKCTRYKTKRAISEEEKNKKYYEKISNTLQKYGNREQNEECGTEVAQVEADNTHESRKWKNCSIIVEKINILDTHKKHGISSSRIHSGCTGKTESPVDRMGNCIPGIINEREKSNYKESEYVLSTQSVTGSLVFDEVNITGNEKGKKTRSREKSIEEGQTYTVSEKHKTSEILDQRCAKHTSSDEGNYKNEKNLSNSCPNGKNKEENKEPGFEVSQTDVDNAKESKARIHEYCSKTVQEMSVTDKNTQDGVMKSRLHHDCIGDIKSAVDKVKYVTPPSAVNNKQKSDTKEFKHDSSDHHATKLSSASNENEKSRTRRSRTRSCEDENDLITGLEKQKMADTAGETNVSHKPDSVNLEERKKSTYLKDENSKLSSSQNYKETMGKNKDFKVEVADTEAGSIKHSKATRKEEEISKHVQKMSMLETNKGDDITKPRMQDSNKIQRESVKRTKDVRLNEKEKSACKKSQHGKYKDPITEPPVSHEIIKMGAVEVSHKSVSRDNSVEIHSESIKVSPLLNLKFHARRSMEYKLEDSKVVLSVNITPPKDPVKMENSSEGLTTESLDMSAGRIKSVSDTQKLIDDKDSRKNLLVSWNNGGNTNYNITKEVPKVNGTDTFHSVVIGDNAITYKNKRTEHLQVTSQVENAHKLEVETDLNFRNKYTNVFADYSEESEDSSKGWKFDSSNSFYNSDHNSKDLWHPKRGKAKISKETKSQ
jgi:hypothetical protein